MMNIKGKIVFITGASSGIGMESAKAFAKEGCKLILTARRIDRIKILAAELLKEFGTESLTLPLDVRKKEEVFTLFEKLPNDWKKIDILLNNAGVGKGLSPLHDSDPEGWDEMIDTNVKGLLFITKSVSNLMIKNGSGHIINVGSVAGREVYPNGNVYCATKFAVNALTKAMRVELYDKNIRVTTVDPGMVETEFSLVRFDGDEERAKNVYKGMTPLSPADIADTIIFCATRPAHVNISEVVIYPSDQANTTTVKRS
ncbi:MAG: SDR family NAD(P)-dependent oxidoreductase [Ignavibacteriales bacterium]|nr:SDR family NAD(P)-dependent oxidoreductase [Ignavibacteriales bacterium]MBK8664046.1 SDR family NAD(P)-dependent oxidoreductase [Ignavibacteriales bacterium]